MSSILVSIFVCVVLHKDERQAMLSLCLPFIFLILPAIETKLRVTLHIHTANNTHTCMHKHKQPHAQSTTHLHTHDDICNVSILLSTEMY